MPRKKLKRSSRRFSNFKIRWQKFCEKILLRDVLKRSHSRHPISRTRLPSKIYKRFRLIFDLEIGGSIFNRKFRLQSVSYLTGKLLQFMFTKPQFYPTLTRNEHLIVTTLGSRVVNYSHYILLLLNANSIYYFI